MNILTLLLMKTQYMRGIIRNLMLLVVEMGQVLLLLYLIL